MKSLSLRATFDGCCVMEVVGSYRDEGAAHVRESIAPEISQALLN